MIARMIEIDEKRIVGEFVIITGRREISDEQLKTIEEDKVLDAESVAYLHIHRKCECIRIEHISGIWSVEYPYYSSTYHLLQSFGDSDDDALNNLLVFQLENSMIVGDEEFMKDIFDAKVRLLERMRSTDTEQQ